MNKINKSNLLDGINDMDMMVKRMSREWLSRGCGITKSYPVDAEMHEAWRRYRHCGIARKFGYQIGD